MDLNYNRSLNKKGRKDSHSEPSASESRANHQMASSEPDEQKTITKTTNETSKKQIAQPNTHSHSIENILKKHHLEHNVDAHNLTAEHVPETESSHPQDQPKRQHKSLTIQHDVNFERPGPSQFQNLQTTELLKQHKTTEMTAETAKQLLLRNKKEARMPRQSNTKIDMKLASQADISQTTALSSVRYPQNKRQKIVFYQRSIPVINLPQHSPRPQNSQTGVSILNREIILQKETQTHQQTHYTHLKIAKPQSQSLNQKKPKQRTQTEPRKQRLTNQDISHLKLTQPPDRQEKPAHQQSFQKNSSIKILPKPQVQLTFLEHQKESSKLASQLLQCPNLLFNIATQLSKSPITSVNIASPLPQSSGVLVNISNRLPQLQASPLAITSQPTQSETLPLLSSSRQSREVTQPIPKQVLHKIVVPRDLKSSEVSDIQVSQSPNLFLNISSPLSQSQTSSLNTSGQKSQDETQRNHEEASCEKVIPRDLQSLEASDLTPEIDLTIEELLESYLTSCNNN